ncbi:FtsX-like permease family protein [Nakamurella lactea]|uniref:FtsX-like permease family protein n=1 Tax=Nakamurella lactea TaxID=459515 RepID=UPI00048E44F0|nr:FtsX-like permease family protein [Nakamurella lactea]
MVRRSGVRVRLLVAITALTFTVTLLLTAIIGMSQRDAADGVRGYLAEVDDTARVSVLSTSLAADPAAQSAEFSTLVGTAFGDLPVQQLRRVVSAPYTVPGADGRSLRLGSYDGFTEHARITAGNWPATTGSGPQAVAVSSAVATEWGLTAGATIEATPPSGTARTLRVAAIFEPDGSTFWSANSTLVSGSAVADYSPVLMVDPAALTAGGSTPSVSWTLQPEVERIRPDQVAPMSAAAVRLPELVRADQAVNVNGVLTGGGLITTLGVLQGSLDAAVVAQPLPIMLVIAFGLVMISQIGRLVTSDRRSETALLVSRGLSAGRASWWAGLEAALFASVGAVLGLAAATLVAQVPSAGWWIATGTVLAAVLACALPAWRDGAARLTRDRLDDSGRGRIAVAGGVLVLLAAAAAFAVWRFRRSGADAVTDVDGRRVLDPAVLFAPPVTLVAFAAVGVVLFGLLTTLAERGVAGASTALTAVLPARQVARRRTVFGAAVMLIALAVGGATVAAGYASTTAEHQRVTEQLANGSDVRVVTTGSSLSSFAAFSDPAARYAALPGVTAVAPVLRAAGTAGDTPVTLIGINPPALPALTRPAPSYDPDAMAELLRPTGSGADAEVVPGSVVLPDGTGGLTVRIRLSASGGLLDDTASVPVGVWLLTPDGALAPASLGAGTVKLEGDSRFELTADLPGLRAGTRLLAVDLQLSGANEPISYSAEVTVLARTGPTTAPIERTGWTVQPTVAGQGAPQQFTGSSTDATTGLNFHGRKESSNAEPQPTTVRLMPAAPAAGGVPVVVDASMAQALGLRVGDRITVSLPGLPLRAEVAGIAERIPGFAGPDLMLADLPALQTEMLRSAVVLPGTNETWLATGDPVQTAAAARALTGPTAIVTGVGSGSVDVLLRPAVRALWWGTGGALLLAAVGMLLVMATLARSRRAELTVLRAMGVPSVVQARMRRRELLATALPAWIFGLAAGFGTALLIVPGLARQAVVAGSSQENPPLLMAWQTWGLLLGVHVLLVLLAIGWHSVAVRRQAHAADPREVTA